MKNKSTSHPFLREKRNDWEGLTRIKEESDFVFSPKVWGGWEIKLLLGRVLNINSADKRFGVS